MSHDESQLLIKSVLRLCSYHRYPVVHSKGQPWDETRTILLQPWLQTMGESGEMWDRVVRGLMRHTAEGITKLLHESEEEESVESDSGGSEGAIPELDHVWKNGVSSLTRKLFKAIDQGEVEKIEKMLQPEAAHACKESGNCLLCREAYSDGDDVVAYPCHTATKCPSVFHPWCASKWYDQGTPPLLAFCVEPASFLMACFLRSAHIGW
eukprot:s78_g44.t1